jgi:hypothetical protein
MRVASSRGILSRLLAENPFPILRFTLIYQLPAYSAFSIVKLPQTACQYRQEAVYEAVLMGEIGPN